MSERRAVLLDRDGTINVDHGYVFTADRLELCLGAASAIGDLKRAGFLVAVVSNQSAVGRGWATIDQVESTNRNLQALLLNADPDALLDYVAYCPDGPEATSTRRKPAIGMFEEISAALNVAPEDCWVIGDKPSDVEFGIRAGFPQTQCLLIGSGSGAHTERTLADLRAAATQILSQNLP